MQIQKQIMTVFWILAETAFTVVVVLSSTTAKTTATQNAAFAFVSTRTARIKTAQKETLSSSSSSSCSPSSHRYEKHFFSSLLLYSSADRNGEQESSNPQKLDFLEIDEPVVDRRRRNNDENIKRRSLITSIRCENLAGMGEPSSSSSSNQIVLDLTTTNTDLFNAGEPLSTSNETTIHNHNKPQIDATATNCDSTRSNTNLVAVTGETGSGKSLLICKVADLVTGGKATASLLATTRMSSNNRNDDAAVNNGENDNHPPTATVEMVLSLRDSAHVAMVTRMLHALGLDPSEFLEHGERLDEPMQPEDNRCSPVVLRLKRVLNLIQHGQRVKSTCYLNDKAVPLKALKAIGTPLLAIVNAPAAASALSRPASRLFMLDAGVPPTVLAWVRQLQTVYRKCRTYRQTLEKEIASQIVPISMTAGGGNDDGRDLELLRHWVDELDGFEARISNVRDSLCSTDSLMDTIFDVSEMDDLLQDLNEIHWMSDDVGSGKESDSFSSGLYSKLLDLLDYIKTLDQRINAAAQARDSLGSLSSPDSAYTAIDRTRKLLLDATKGESTSGDKSKSTLAAEQAHQLLNQVEDALLECSDFLDDDDNGLAASLKATRRRCPVSVEELLEYITEWNTLARKHGISPYQLPSCHDSLRQELDGGLEAKIKLPKAKEAEKKARQALEEGCVMLTKSRKTLCQRLSDSITARLPLLGMENSIFEARLRTIENSSYGPATLGVDEVDFYLLHNGKQESRTFEEPTDIRNLKQQIGGKLENVASSGEKARILLAIECEIPGSVRALCGTPTENVGMLDDQESFVAPVAVIYDEIDAHVGGRASVSVAQMLVEQSRSCQVLSITHSPSLAAVADTHVCITKGGSDKYDGILLRAEQVVGTERRKELARMASGDVAPEEAEIFAEALLRDVSASRIREQERIQEHST